MILEIILMSTVFFLTVNSGDIQMNIGGTPLTKEALSQLTPKQLKDLEKINNRSFLDWIQGSDFDCVQPQDSQTLQAMQPNLPKDFSWTEKEESIESYNNRTRPHSITYALTALPMISVWAFAACAGCTTACFPKCGQIAIGAALFGGAPVSGATMLACLACECYICCGYRNCVGKKQHSFDKEVSAITKANANELQKIPS